MSDHDITKEGIRVKPGQVWLDLDKRTNGGRRTVTVDRVVDGGAFVTTNGVSKANGKPYTSRLSVRRMHKGATGWALVSEAP